MRLTKNTHKQNTTAFPFCDGTTKHVSSGGGSGGSTALCVSTAPESQGSVLGMPR